jgi:hypothetical protein
MVAGGPEFNLDGAADAVKTDRNRTIDPPRAPGIMTGPCYQTAG